MKQETSKKYNISQPSHIVMVGNVDHGKSTLIGRLLYDTGSLPEGKYEELQELCASRDSKNIEWAYLLDCFQAERDQAMTIDASHAGFSRGERNFVIIDAPGHGELLKNMASGASLANSAIIVIDAKRGIEEQTFRHAYLLHILGVKQIGVVINKMDMVSYSKDIYKKLSSEITSYLLSIGISPSFIVPISARHGDMIATISNKMDWYEGERLLDSLSHFTVSSPPVDVSLRFVVQDVYGSEKQRVIVGRVETGILREGDMILFSPLNESAKVSSIEVWPDNPDKIEARAGESVGIILDKNLPVERGDIASHMGAALILSNMFQADICLLSEQHLKKNGDYKIRYGARVESVCLISMHGNMPIQATFKASDILPFDTYKDNERLGRIVIYEGGRVVAIGMITKIINETDKPVDFSNLQDVNCP